MRVCLMLSVLLMAGCSIVPRDGRLPEVRLHIAEDYCHAVKLRNKVEGMHGSGIVVQCIRLLSN